MAKTMKPEVKQEAYLQGPAPLTLEDALKSVGMKHGRQISTGFTPVWACDSDAQAGEYVIGSYQGNSQVDFGKKGFTVYNVAVKLCRGTFLRSKKPVEVTPGEIISLSGDVIGKALATVKEGQEISIKFLGLGQKKGKNNAAKLWEVTEILG